jgi:glycosyltransferase involved in cell wall biosynthesis
LRIENAFSILQFVVLLAWITTLVRTILNLSLIPRLRPDADPHGPLVSVIIPARNEAASIERTVRAFLAQTYADLEIVVVDDRSSDATASILASIAAVDDRLRVIHGAELPEGWLGKPWALHQGQGFARGEMLLFVDADIVYEPPAVAAAVRQLRESETSMVTLFPRLVMQTFWEKLAMPYLAFTAYSILPTWLANRTRIPILGVGGGTGNLVRRDHYEAVGGHASLREAVVDDVATARLLRRNGYTTTVAGASSLTSVRMYAGRAAIVEGFTKNIFAVFHRSYVLTLTLAALGVIFHVLPYWWALTGELLSAITVVLITATRLILFAALRYPLSYAVWAHPFMILFWTWLWLRSMWITGIRKQLAWRGRTYDADRTHFGA